MTKFQPPKRQYAHLSLMKDIEEVLENPQECEYEVEKSIKVIKKKIFIHSTGLRKSIIHIIRVPGRKTKRKQNNVK